jgi:serine/threonine protein phosphatase PrpC
MKYSSKSITNVGKVRSANEDNFGEALTPNGHLFVVCDGMGGHVGGAEASKIAVDSIIEFFQKEIYDNVIQAIDHALSFANEQIYASALSNPELKGMGTTAVVLLIRDEECFIGHVGDSRIYLRSDGKLNRITKDHSFVQTLVDSGVIDDEDAENHPNKNQILQALGIASSVKGTICQSPILPKAGDMFLMCSDGLNGMVTDRDIEKIVKEDNLMVTSENLITAALNGGGHDNVTATLILIEESQHSQSRFVHFNPKPKAIDMTSTQQFGVGVNTDKPKKSKLPYFIGGGVLLLGASIALMMMNGKVVEKEIMTHKKYKIETLEGATDCENILVGDSVDVDKDTTVRITCKSDSLVIKIEEKVIVSIDIPDESNHIEVDSDDAKVVNKKKKDADKTKEKTENKDDGIIKTHTVKEKETLSLIVSKYIGVSPGLTVEALKDFNVEDKNSALTDKQKADLSADKITAGMKLKIPKMDK